MSVMSMPVFDGNLQIHHTACDEFTGIPSLVLQTS